MTKVVLSHEDIYDAIVFAIKNGWNDGIKKMIPGKANIELKIMHDTITKSTDVQCHIESKHDA